MASVEVRVQSDIAAPAERVFALLADYAETRPQLLPDAYSNYRVVTGGTGAGTEYEVHLAAGRRERDLAMTVSEPGPLQLEERDGNSSLRTEWTVQQAGAGSAVKVLTTWTGAGGIAGVMERTFAPIGVRKHYHEMLQRLGAKATTTTET
jgi:Polyketide cyclase / dehydrase and lipid transport